MHHQPYPSQHQHPSEMDPHHMHPYAPQPSRAPSSHRSHSRSGSAVYANAPPPHGHFSAPHHDMPPPGYAGAPGPYHPAASMIPAHESMDSRHGRSQSHSMSNMHAPPPSGYRTPPPPPHMVPVDSHGWPGPPPHHHTSLNPPADHHPHQRAPHHPHPYQVVPPPSRVSHSRTPSRSHSRSQSLSQPQYAPQHGVQSPPPPRHASPSAPVPAPRYVKEIYSEKLDKVDPVRFPPAPVLQPPVLSMPVPIAYDEDELDGEIVQGAARRSGMPADDDQAESSKCPDCGKMYKHATSLLKHRWEHSLYWKSATKFLMTKHQQVQMMEAAAILLGMVESRGEGDRDAVVGLFVKQRGQFASVTSTSSVSPPTSTKSLSASPPPMAERALAIASESTAAHSIMSPPPFHGVSATRHSVTSTTSSASSLSSTPPSLAPDDESVAEPEDDMMSVSPQYRQQHHHQQQPHQMQHPSVPMDKHVEPSFYQPDSRYPSGSYPHHPHHPTGPPQHQSYAPFYHDQH